MNSRSANTDETINNPHDVFFKKLIGRRATAVQFLKLYLPADLTAAFDWRTLERVPDTKEILDSAFADSEEGEAMQTIFDIYREEGREEGRRLEAANWVLRLLAGRFNKVSARAEARIHRLSLRQLEKLGDALPNFSKPADLTAWLRANPAVVAKAPRRRAASAKLFANA